MAIRCALEKGGVLGVKGKVFRNYEVEERYSKVVAKEVDDGVFKSEGKALNQILEPFLDAVFLEGVKIPKKDLLSVEVKKEHAKRIKELSSAYGVKTGKVVEQAIEFYQLKNGVV